MKCKYCAGHVVARGMCRKHYSRWHKTGDPTKARQYGGSRTVTAGGYILIWVDGKRKQEHVHLAEKALGRSLPKGARVHHMNETPWDNFTPFNLVICPNQSYHRLLHERMKQYAASHR